MTIAQQLGIETRRAPGTPRRPRGRMRRTQHPACLGSRRQRLRRHSQQKSGHAGRLRGQRQLAARHEIELPDIAPELEHDRAQRIAGERIGRGAQRALDIGGAHHHHTARIEADFGEPAHRQRAGFDFRKILPHPQQRLACRHTARKSGDKTCRGGALPSLAKHLMDCRAREPALQRAINLAVAERDTILPMHDLRRLDALDLTAQDRKRADACAAHIRRSFRVIARGSQK